MMFFNKNIIVIARRASPDEAILVTNLEIASWRLGAIRNDGTIT